jgi:hypothetical protein
LIKSQNKGKINPEWAAMKGRHPTWGTSEESRHHWRKVFYIRGKKAGKRVQKKFKRWTRETIRRLDCFIF